MENKRYKKEQDIHLTKEEYLAQLKKYLKRLPKEDYNNAMDYFTEYFEDAGSEGETSLMQELGTPKEAASVIIGGKLFLRGAVAITASLSGASLISGAGLFSIGLGILAVLAVIYFCKWIILGLAHLIQNMSRKRSVK